MKKSKEQDYRLFSIYGIFVGSNLYYIGLTGREPEERWSEHKWFVEHKYKPHAQQNKLYQAIRIARERKTPEQYKVLYQIYTSRSRAEQIEAEFIIKFQPKWNIQGKTIPYNFIPKSKKKWY